MITSEWIENHRDYPAYVQAALACDQAFEEFHMPDRFQVTETTETRQGYRGEYETTHYTIVRTDGARDWRISYTKYTDPAAADLHCKFLNGVGDEYNIERRTYPARTGRRGHFWRISGGRIGDPRPLNQQVDEGDEERTKFAVDEGLDLAGLMIRIATRHAAGADKRIAAEAEREAIAEAEAEVQQARADQLSRIAESKGPLATPRQVDYILSLLDARRYDGNGGGFFTGPTNRPGIEELSRGEASMYIDSLKENY